MDLYNRGGFCKGYLFEKDKKEIIDIAVEGNISKQKQIEIMNEFDMIDIPYMTDIVFMCELKKDEFIQSIKKDGVLYE